MAQFLYPPAVDTAMPAFEQDQICRIYFSPGKMNNIADIKHVQVRLAYSNTNYNALNIHKWPAEIMICNISGTVEDGYYVEIDPTKQFIGDDPIPETGDLETYSFETGLLYKANLRFSAVAPDSKLKYTEVSGGWFIENQDYFSQWSSVVLIKGIPDPNITFLQFSENSVKNALTVSAYDNLNITTDQYHYYLNNNGFFPNTFSGDFTNWSFTNTESTLTSGINGNKVNFNLTSVSSGSNLKIISPKFNILNGKQATEKTLFRDGSGVFYYDTRASGSPNAGYIQLTTLDTKARFNSSGATGTVPVSLGFEFFNSQNALISGNFINLYPELMVTYGPKAYNYNMPVSKIPSGAAFVRSFINVSGGSFNIEMEPFLPENGIFYYYGVAEPTAIGSISGAVTSHTYNTPSGLFHQGFNTQNVFIGDEHAEDELEFHGRYSNLDITEPLSYYWAQLYEGTVEVSGDNGYLNHTPIADTGILYPVRSTQTLYTSNIQNEFKYYFDSILVDSRKYTIIFRYTTKNGYSETLIYQFITAYSRPFLDDLHISYLTDNEDGIIKLQIDIDANAEREAGILAIRRASHKSNFARWELIYKDASIFENPEGGLITSKITKTIADYSAESGNLYRYWVSQKYMPEEGSGYIYPQYEHMYLVGEERQLKIKFNPEVGSLKYNVFDSRTDTLGGVYPFVRRNGNVKYRELAINGLISMESDENDLFTSDLELYNGHASGFTEINMMQVPELNYTKEREFRNKVMDFLYDGKVKLFKSTQEGNILVKVTEVSLTPENALGRLIYSFSATLTEVDQCTIANLKSYGIKITEDL